MMEQTLLHWDVYSNLLTLTGMNFHVSYLFYGKMNSKVALQHFSLSIMSAAHKEAMSLQ